MTFELATAARVVFGAGKLTELPAALNAQGAHRVFVATNMQAGPVDRLRGLLATTRVEAEVFAVPHEPTVELVSAAKARLLESGCDAVIGFGGGSAMDTAKAVAALATNPGELLDYLEVVGRGLPLRLRPLPLVAIPTTAGTGAEVTRNAVLGVPASRVKVSLRSPYLLPALALVDPDLLEGLPAHVLATSGMDALVHLSEALVSARANPITDALATDGLRRWARAMRKAYCEGLDAQLREDLALASLFGGLCLANGGLGAAHGFAAPLGGMLNAPHGAICAALLAPVMEVNHRALQARDGKSIALARYAVLAGLLTGRPGATLPEASAYVRELCKVMNMDGLGRLGLAREEVPNAVAKAKVASSMRGNPIILTDDELTAIVEMAL